MKNSNELILTIELVPSKAWGKNVRSAVSKSTWDKIRKPVYAQYNYKCGICGEKGQLSCHELWEYDDDHHIQKLKGFIALCPMCHHIKHIGRAQILVSQGKLDFKKLIQHFLTVNECDITTFKRHHEEAFEKWRNRSNFDWKIDFGEYNELIMNDQKN